MTNGQEQFAFCLNLCIARHMARVYGENEAMAITRAARKVRDATKDQKMYELAKAYSREVEPKTIKGERLTGDQLKVLSIVNMEKDMRDKGVL